MFEFSPEDVERVFEQNSMSPEQLRQQMQNQAMIFLMENQETYVARWILQNPYANISDYRLKFVYSDTSHTGYTVEMERIENV